MDAILAHAHKTVNDVNAYPDGVNVLLDVDDLGVVKAPHQVNNHLHVPDVRQKLVAKAATLTGTSNQARDVDEADLTVTHDVTTNIDQTTQARPQATVESAHE